MVIPSEVEESVWLTWPTFSNRFLGFTSGTLIAIPRLGFVRNDHDEKPADCLLLLAGLSWASP